MEQLKSKMFDARLVYQKVSCLPNTPFQADATQQFGRVTGVSLDGVMRFDCVRADAFEGWIEVYVFGDDFLAIERLYGAVELFWSDDFVASVK
jgi:hypothetical protein